VQSSTTGAFDAIVIGAGFAGIYMVHRLRESGFSVHGLEAGGGVGGTWYWNRYPGARCDSESMYYSFSFLPEFEQDWPLEQRYPTQPMILRYLEAVTDHLDLRGHFTFDARVGSVTYDSGTERWTVRTTGGLVVTATYVITAVGALSAANVPRYPGAETFAGDQLSTANWPHDPVSFAGRRVGLIGTGSSGVQVLPQIAREAAHVTVFQRTPQFVTPARSEPLDPQLAVMWKTNYREIRRRTKNTPGGIPMPDPHQSALELSAEERIAVCEEAWRRGGIWFLGGTFSDVVENLESNTVVADFVRSKIDELIDDPETAEKLKPTTYPWGTKRVPIGSDYYETYNRPNVSLVDIRADPIEEITPAGIRTRSGDHELDAIVYATGFDALTGALLALDIRGRRGEALAETWAEGPRTYLGLMVPNFPSLFTITGPGSPGVVTNVPAAIEQHVEWIADCLCHMRDRGFDSIEATEGATAEWTQHVQDVANDTLYPAADSWYMGANIPGKPRLFLPYIGGLGVYAGKCEEIVQGGYQGFAFSRSIHVAAGEVADGAG
jgi:cyclohexanone monooxygenase